MDGFDDYRKIMKELISTLLRDAKKFTEEKSPTATWCGATYDEWREFYEECVNQEKEE